MPLIMLVFTEEGELREDLSKDKKVPSMARPGPSIVKKGKLYGVDYWVERRILGSLLK